LKNKGILPEEAKVIEIPPILYEVFFLKKIAEQKDKKGHSARNIPISFAHRLYDLQLRCFL
jgi:hypothetical protein